MTNDQLLKNLETRIENLQRNMLANAQLTNSVLQTLINLKDLLLNFQTIKLQHLHRNPLNRFGRKCFSQTDEDGITLEIIRRLGITDGIYAEFGVGDGLENNTLILATLGWKGFWVGGEDLAFTHINSSKFKYYRKWITLDNILNCAQTGLAEIGSESPDVISLDFDGNDIYFVHELISNGIKPKLFIVEYNAKFIPPARFQIAYDPNHQWAGDDYFGAALMNFVDLFREHGYHLICCNSHTGANAFFLKDTYKELFPETPSNVLDIWVEPRYHLYNQYGHKKSTKVISQILG